MRWTPIFLLLPPFLSVMEDLALSFRTTTFFIKRNLVAETELDEFSNMEMALHGSLDIQIIPYAAFRPESEIVRSLFTARSVRSLICQRTLRNDRSMIILMVIIVQIAGRIIEIDTPVKYSSNSSEFEFIIQGQSCARLLGKRIIHSSFAATCGTQDIFLVLLYLAILIQVNIIITATIQITSCILGNATILEHIQSEADSVLIVQMIDSACMET